MVLKISHIFRLKKVFKLNFPSLPTFFFSRASLRNQKGSWMKVESESVSSRVSSAEQIKVLKECFAWVENVSKNVNEK